MRAGIKAVKKGDRKRRLKLNCFVDRSLCLAYLSSIRQRTGEIQLRPEGGVGELTGLSAICDGLIVATEIT